MPSILETLKTIFSEVLLSPANEISINKPYVDMGIDSILAIQVSKLIQLKFQVEVLPSDLYNFLSIQDLSTHIEGLKNSSANGTRERELMFSENKPTVENQKIAIVGIAARFPGSDTVQQYWDNLFDNQCAIKETTRWKSEEQKKYVGGFLENIENFDANFFNISPREAIFMDPQQRIMLETAWQAFEDGGLTIDTLSQSQCGVFVTSLPGDYKYRFQDNKSNYNSFSFLGNATALLSGRISHFFNLKGPSITIDTACSSSLVAIDMAVNALKNQSCNIALVGAVSIFSTPELFELAQAANLVSQQGLCYTFDERADGFIPAEGVACLVLRRLTDALLEKQNIYGVIEAVKVNHDGHTNGVMSPNSYSQKNLLLALYKEASIKPNQIAYLEAHGTGTAIGDPIETKALAETFFELSNDYDTYLGSSKANIGHSLVVSGMAGVIKILGCFKRNQIPPQINFKKLNPQINLGKFQINIKTEQWPINKNMASVSAFGFGGTNAHLVLSKLENETPIISTMKPYLFIFSAKTNGSLNAILNKFVPFLEAAEEAQFEHISFTLACHRTRFSKFLIFISKTKQELTQRIRQYLEKGLNDFYEYENTHPDLVSLAKKTTIYELPSIRHLYNDLCKIVALPYYTFESEKFWMPFEEILQAPSFSKEHRTNSINKTVTIKKIREILSDLLGYERDKIDVYKPFSELGVDSLIALQLLAPFTDSLGKLSAHIVFEQNNIENLAEYLTTLSSKSNLPSVEQKELKYLKFLKALPYQRIIPTESNKQLEWIIVNKTGKPILLLPPLNMLAHAWIQQLRHLAGKEFQIFIPHYPGHGASPFVEKKLEVLARDILYSFNGLSKNLQTYTLMGWSLGGCLSLILGGIDTKRIEKMILINTAAKFEDDLFSESAKLRSELLEKSEYLNALFNTNEHIIDYMSANCSLDVLKHYYTELQKFDVTQELSTMKIPVEIIHGMNDPVVGDSDIQFLNKISNSNLHIFESGGHFVPLTLPYIFNKQFDKFITT